MNAKSMVTFVVYTEASRTPRMVPGTGQTPRYVWNA